MKQSYEEYVERNWKPNVKRMTVVSGCNCASCQLNRQLKTEWDKNQEQAREFERHLRENKAGQQREFQRYMADKHSSIMGHIPQHQADDIVRRNRKTL